MDDESLKTHNNFVPIAISLKPLTLQLEFHMISETQLENLNWRIEQRKTGVGGAGINILSGILASLYQIASKK